MKKAIFALNSAKDRAYLIEYIDLNNYPTPDTFVWWNGIQLVVCSTTESVVDWFIDGNAYVRIVEQEPGEFHIMRVEHAPHLVDKEHDFKNNGGGGISGYSYASPNCLNSTTCLENNENQ